MTSPRKNRYLLTAGALLGAFSMLAAACGSSDGDDSADGPAPTTSPPATTSPTTDAGDVTTAPPPTTTSPTEPEVQYPEPQPVLTAEQVSMRLGLGDDQVFANLSGTFNSLFQRGGFRAEDIFDVEITEAKVNELNQAQEDWRNTYLDDWRQCNSDFFFSPEFVNADLTDPDTPPKQP